MNGSREEAYLNNLANMEDSRCDTHRKRLTRSVVGFLLKDEARGDDAHVFSVEYRCGCCRVFVRGRTAAAEEVGWSFVRKVMTDAERAQESASTLGAQISARYSRH